MKTIEKKDPYLHILNTQGNVYEEFLPDQVLTHKNLNKVVDYFEDQDRLSRVYLIGVGIGCGINIVSYSNSEIIVGQGVGITTDGDIIQTETRRFQYYLELTDRANYDLFDGMEVYEIYEQEGAGRLEDELPLSSFNSNVRGTLKDYILLAYVENYTEDEGLCGGSGCDETGNKVYSNLKFLLTHKDNYDTLISNDTIYQSHDVLSYYDTLPELCMPRLLLTKNNTVSGIGIHDQFKNAFFLKNELYTGITTIIQRFSHRINFAKFGVNIPQITAYFDDIFTVTQEQFIQYKYDLLKDLIDTYREIRDLILETRFECVANINAFPKHLLLGTLEETTRLQTRHSFYPSPTVSENDKNLMAIRALCIKFFNQLKEYRIPNVSTAAIKITPSKSYEFKLSERSIPYYYETKNALISNWNPLSIQLRKLKKHLGYHVSNLQNIPCVQKPLEYSHLDKDFYRIEGHLGKDFRLALRKINSLKARYNLAFDVKTVSIGFPVNKVTLDDDKCDTKDYAILLKTWEQEFCCTAESATEFFQKYQYDNLGDNDTNTSVYGYSNFDPSVLQLLKSRNKEGEESTEETTEKPKSLSINTSNATGQLQERYQTSIQYAMDQAYIYVGEETAPAGYIAGIALGIIEEITGNNTNDDDDYFFYTESAVKIVASLSEIKRLFLQSLDEIYNTEKWTALNNAIDLLCTDVDQVLFAISEAGENATFGSRTHDKMYEYFIYELSKICCLKGRFTWLKEQIDAIRYDIYSELILSKLIEKHPGAEHMAGVPKGGTFLMVYLGGTEEMLEDDSILRQFNGIVQFDFALPYMCCADCPPETVVYNVEPETTLTIAKTKYCLPTDEGLVDFVAQSTGAGIVTSPQGDAFIVPTDSGYAFDPTAVPDDLIGEILTCLVDGNTPTIPVEICVFKFPTDITAIYELVEWTATGITLNLTVSHEEVPYPYNYTYTWQREDESEIGTGTDITEISFDTTGDQFEETFNVSIGIEGQPVLCTIPVEVPINESRPIPEDIVVPEIICYDLIETSPLKPEIIVTPFGATLASPQEPVDGDRFIEQNDEGRYFINPARVPHGLAGDEITFTVNGNPIENKSTRIGMLPAFINRDEAGSNIKAHEIVEWNDEGALINISAAHQFQDETYIEYKWIDRDDTDITLGRTREVSNVQVRGIGNTISARYRVEMRVIGLEESCITSFNVDITLNRPTLNIETGICFGESVPLEVEPDDIVTTSLRNNVIENISDTVTFESGLVANADIGREIEIFINNTSVATTTVYKVPAIENVLANDEFVRFDDNNVIVNLSASFRVPGVTNPENYLEIKWFDAAQNPIPNDELMGYAIGLDDGTVETSFFVSVCVQSNLGVADACETPLIPVPIRYTRPTFDLEKGYCYEIIENDDIEIRVPNVVEITSPQGSDFIIPSGNHYVFRLSEVPMNLIGQRIGFEIGGIEIAHTFVYKIPTDLSGTANEDGWNDDELTVSLTPSYTLDGVTNPENYLRFIWRNDSNQMITPNDHRITAENNQVEKTYTVAVSVNPTLLDTSPCETVPVDVPINFNQPAPTLPPNLGLENSYCWEEDSEPLRISIAVNPNDFVISSPQEDTSHDFVQQNSRNHTFIVSEVPDTDLGTTIQFLINSNLVDETSVYKLPSVSSVTHDRENSRWVQGAYEFRFSHNFDDKDYFRYAVTHAQTGDDIEETAPGTFKVTASGMINESFKVTISVDGLDCAITATVIVADTVEGTGPQTELNCNMSYTERLNRMQVGMLRNDFANGIQNAPFRSQMQVEVLEDVNTLFTQLGRARDVNIIFSMAMQEINRLRGILDANYIRNRSFTDFIDSFLLLDEILEIAAMELLRCTDDFNDNTIGFIDAFFEASTGVNSFYRDDNSRRNIKSGYIANFSPNVSQIRTRVSASFPS